MTLNDQTLERIKVLREMASGFQVSQALYVAAKLGVVDRLGAAPQSVDALARAVGAHPGALYRLLRALEYAGLLHEPKPGEFALTPLGEPLRSDAPGGLREEILLSVGMQWTSWGLLEHCIRTGDSSFPKAHGMPFFEFLYRDPEQVARFNRVMADMIGAMAEGVVAAYDFDRFETIVDIGGGQGVLLATILKDHPRPRGVLLELPATAEEARRFMESRGLAGRVTCVHGDFFEAAAAGDCLVLSGVISDWNDEQSVRILGNCRRALAPGGRLLLLERRLVPEEPASATAFLDLEMLVIGGGTGRSEAEYRRLLAEAGFELARVIPTGTPRSIFEARLA